MPALSEEEIDDLIYFSRAGEYKDLAETLSALATREGVSQAEILVAAKDEGKSTCLHMATGNGHTGKLHDMLPRETSEKLRRFILRFLHNPMNRL